jgi:hypothetical protein
MNRNTNAAAWAILLAILATTSFLGCDDPATDDSGGDVNAESSVVAVEYQGASHDVDITALDAEDVSGVQAVRLDDVLRAALPDADLGGLALDFVAYDGFSPAQSPNCVDLIPLNASVADLGWIEIATANLTWDESLRFPGCLHVRGVVEVLVHDAD